MSEHGEPVERLHLIGYEKLTDHGLALPIFGQSRGANVFYTARSTSPGEANGQIAGFDRYDPDGLVRLPLEQIRETGISEPWLDIFLWEGAVYVGTAPEIWNALAEVRESVAEHAPLSLLTLAEGVQRVPDIQLVHKAFSWLTSRYGTQKASEWRNDTYLREILLRGVRRQSGAFVYKPGMRRRGLGEELVIHQDGTNIIAYLGTPLSKEGMRIEDAFPRLREGMKITDLGVRSAEYLIHFISVVKSFGFEPVLSGGRRGERVVWKRTSENAMRIAALQVAASKPRGKATTTELKNEVHQYVALTPGDVSSSKTRRNEAMYQQIVGNIVSHRESKNNIFAKGWAIYTGDGIQITDAGRQHLRTLGLRS